MIPISSVIPRTPHKLFSICLLTLSVFVVPEVSAARWYHVEVILFKQLANELAGDEDWSVPDRAPNFATAIELDSLTEDGGAIVPLSSSAFYLAGVYDRLRASASYQPVLHRAWAQPGFSANNVRNVYLAELPSLNQDTTDLSLESAEPALEGSIGLQGGRLLHVNVNLVLRDSTLTTTISEFRRIKLKQLHYFDHPLFGALIRVIPYRVEAEE